jgi:hypothetical protein
MQTAAEKEGEIVQVRSAGGRVNTPQMQLRLITAASTSEVMSPSTVTSPRTFGALYAMPQSLAVAPRPYLYTLLATMRHAIA